MIITHILIGRLKNPNDENDTPSVYATISKENTVMWRTWAAKVKPAHCQVFFVKPSCDRYWAATWLQRDYQRGRSRPYKTQQTQLRRNLEDRLQRWETAVQATEDERFRNTMLARAAATCQQHQAMVPNGGGNVDLFLFDYILEYGDTSTWEPTVHLRERDPGR